MIFPFVLLVVSLVCYIDRQQKLAAQVDFPDDLSVWCPHTEFCGQNASTPKVNQENNTLDRLRPCCEPCSCSNDCGLERNCCHDRFDLYNLDKNLRTVCISLDTRETHSNYDEHFHIIDKCPDKKDTCREDIHTCKTIFGHYFPVFSRQNGMLYFNKHCAECNYQIEIEPFITSIYCPSIAYDGINEIFKAVEGIESDCFLRFIKPGNIDISKQKCWPNIIRKCLPTRHDDLENKCYSFNATFTSGSNGYQNVYCFLCSQKYPLSTDKWTSRHTMCTEPPREHRLGESALTVHLDQKSILLYEESVQETREDRHVCFPSTNASHKVCRPLYCPEGKFYVRGACTYLGQTWYVKDLELFVNLTLLDSSNKLTIQDLRQIPTHKLADPLKDFISRPAFQNWNVDLFYNLDPDEINIRFIMAKLFVKNQILTPGRFLSNIDRAIEGVWTLTTTDYVLKFKANFHKYKMYNQMGDGTKYIPFSFEYENGDEIVHTLSEKAPSKFGLNSLIVTKLFSCVQIELWLGDFNYSVYYPEIVFIHSTNKQLGNAEFKLFNGPQGLPQSIRVCIDDVLPQSNTFYQGRISKIALFLVWLTHSVIVRHLF